MAIFVAFSLLMVSARLTFLAHFRFVLLAATLLFVLGLNHRTVTTLQVPGGQMARIGAAPKAAVVKQKVTLEATSSVAVWLAPAADAWFPASVPLTWPRLLAKTLKFAPQPGALPDFFRARLLLAALSPQAP
ncbi:hypothetical protein GCM10011375_03550 [Hymenobacter qilianensis]|uniref:Uncharacterized protein n=1 Tax=Hymenobacter qilianensis TaxID=1385715 RepID=A0ACB5PLT9_9BACT|nr:hypothetical protein GCM10011375_03550 [Hymenobacter qilianensis]